MKTKLKTGPLVTHPELIQLEKKQLKQNAGAEGGERAAPPPLALYACR